MPTSTHSPGTRSAAFPPTRWSVVLATQESSSRARAALATLCQAYWFPLYAFLRRQGRTPHDAEDLTQAFFLHLLDRHALQTVNPAKGRFRSFLLASLKHFVTDEWEKSRAQKRGGGAVPLSLDLHEAEQSYAAERSAGIHPEEAYERRWAISLVERVLARLEMEFKAARREHRFAELRVLLTGDPNHVTYAEVGRRLGMTEGAVKVAVLRLRQRYRELLRAEVANTVATPEEIDDELRYIIELLSR